MMTPEAFVEHFGHSKASAILRTDLPDAAGPAMEAAVRAGFRIVEFTMTTPGALDLIKAFAERDDLVVGAGTVLTLQEAEAAVAAGARFLVSPVVDIDIIAHAIDLGVAVMPGAHTPTEMLLAHRAGAPLQKLFPAPGTGPKFVKSVLGPLPFLRIVPTNGVHENNALSFLKAGAFAVGFTTALFDVNDIAAGRYDAIEERGRKLLAAVGAPTETGAAQ
jgi:Entner-Doudoroff aldolase